MDSVARILELKVDFLKRNYKKPKLWFAILGILVFIILIFPYIDSNTFYYKILLLCFLSSTYPCPIFDSDRTRKILTEMTNSS